MKDSDKKSPIVESLSWGEMIIEDLGSGRDFKLYPGGGRAWDWSQTNTHHSPGIQIADVRELLEKGSEIVVLSRGMQLMLRTCSEVFEFLREQGVTVHVEDTRAAVTIYNQLVEQGRRVGGLFHSTC